MQPAQPTAAGATCSREQNSQEVFPHKISVQEEGQIMSNWSFKGPLGKAEASPGHRCWGPPAGCPPARCHSHILPP